MTFSTSQNHAILQSRILKFNSPALMEHALTHASSLNPLELETTTGLSKQAAVRHEHERLEFLGDSVLSLVITRHLFLRPENFSEGELSKLRSTMVCQKGLCLVAKKVGLEQHIRVGAGLATKYRKHSGGHALPASVIADTFESVIGAIYLDLGFEEAERFVLESYADLLYGDPLRHLGLDFKTELQELVQAKGLPTPTYKVLKKSGPEHDPNYCVAILIGGSVIATGEGNSIKSASQSAAAHALEQLSTDENNFLPFLDSMHKNMCPPENLTDKVQ